MKFKNYTGQTLHDALITYKIDGVRVHANGGVYTSRSGKTLYNIPPLRDGVYECFLGNFKETISRVRTQKGMLIADDFFYKISPAYDVRLIITHADIATPDAIKDICDEAIQQGYEGLVIDAKEGLFKVKKSYTIDLPIVDMVEGKGRNKGKLGAIVTRMGNVGTGLTDSDREYLWSNKSNLIGTYIEIEAMEVTAGNKLRMPRFIRLREDK